MRELSEQEKKVRTEFWIKYKDEMDGTDTIGEKWAFEDGFIAGLDYAQKKLDAYAAYVVGKITLKELEEVINS